MFEARDRTRRDPRSALQILGGDTRQSETGDTVAGTLPGIARDAEHRRFAGAGIADDDAEILCLRDMLERIALLGRQHHAALSGTRQRRGPFEVTNPVARAVRHRDRRAFEPLFGLDHIAAGEALLAAPVLTQRNEIGRRAHRRDHLIVLLLPFAVAMHEHREVAGGEGCLSLRDRVERDTGIGQNLLAIAPRDLDMLGKPLGLQPLRVHPRRGGADLVLGFEVDSLSVQTAMIDTRIDIEFGKPGIDVTGPALAPLFEQRGCIPVPDLGAEAVLVDRARRQHDMSMGFGETVGADIPMHIEIGDHAAIDELGLHELAREANALRLVQLARDRELDLAGELRVLAKLGRLDRIPELFAVGEILRRAVRQHHFAVDDARLVREIVMAIEPLVVQPRGRAIGRRRQGGRARTPRDHLRREVVDRHDGNPLTPQRPCRHDV